MTLLRNILAAAVLTTAAIPQSAFAKDADPALGALVDAAYDSFATIKGDALAETDKAWASLVNPEGMLCTVREDADESGGLEFASLTCSTSDDLALPELRARALKIERAFGAMFPDWSWFKHTVESGYPDDIRYFGKAENELSFSFEIAEDDFGPYFLFRIDDLTYKLDEPLLASPAP